jgi:PPOX class probable F420-dependent enzyme
LEALATQASLEALAIADLPGPPARRRATIEQGMDAPACARPNFPASYGIQPEPAGMLAWEDAARRLEQARNYWLCTTTADGRPHARPVWAVWLADRLCFSTDVSSVKGRNIARDPRVTVHLESGDDVVIVDGVVEPIPPALAEPLAEAYKNKYDWAVTVGESGWYAIRPLRAYAWSEASFPTTATRFEFT